MALGLHLERPPPRTASLQRSKQTPLLSNKRNSEADFSLVTAFLSNLEFATAPSSSPVLGPNDWTVLSQDEMGLFDLDFPSSPSFDDDIPLPSTPSTPRFFARIFPDVKESCESEPEEDIDIEIPLMTSLFFDDGGCTISFPRDSPPPTRPRRGKAVPSQSFPSDVDSWYISRPPTPRSTTPELHLELSSTPFECSFSLPTTVEPIQPLSVAQELLRFHSKRRRQPQHTTSPPRRLPRPPVSSKAASPADAVTRPIIPSQKTVVAAPTQPTKPKSRPLPPTPLSKPPMVINNTVVNNSESSFLNLSNPRDTLDDQMSLDFDGLVDIVDDMINSQRLSSFTIGDICSMEPVLPLRRR